MNIKLINRIIPFCMVILFFVWGWIEGSNQHSWLVFVVGGMLMGILWIIDMVKGKEAGKQDEDD